MGDQVDVLLGLLERIYLTLDRYSPVLQQYFEVSYVHNVENVLYFHVVVLKCLVQSETSDHQPMILTQTSQKLSSSYSISLRKL